MDRPEAATIILRRSGMVMCTGNRAFHSPAADHVQLPPEHAFPSLP